MEGLTTGAGLGALGFWIFVAAITGVGVWDTIRKRDTQHETLRRAIESGRPLDDEFVDKLLSLTRGSEHAARDLAVGGMVLFGVAFGLVPFGWILSVVLEPKLLPILFAVAVLLACIGGGLSAAARVARRWNHDSDHATAS